MRIHPRERIVAQASQDINKAINDAVEKHELTDWELVQILTTRIASEAKYGIRFDRHGNHEDEGGLES
jgi:hypothetical protein